VRFEWGSGVAHVGNRPKGARGSERFAELENRDGRLGTHRRRRGSSLGRACLQMRKDTVDDAGFGDHGDDFHFSAAWGAYQSAVLGRRRAEHHRPADRFRVT